MNQVNWTQILEAINKHDIDRYTFRVCSICDMPAFYSFYRGYDGKVVSIDRNTSCRCLIKNPVEVKPLELLTHFNNPDPDTRAKLWQTFISKTRP